MKQRKTLSENKTNVILILSQKSKCSILSTGIELRGAKLYNYVNKNIPVLVPLFIVKKHLVKVPGSVI